MSININLIDMENVKWILIEFMEYYNDGNVFSIEEADIDGFIMQSKYRPREPRAVNRNEQTQEVCAKTGLCDIAEKYGFCPYTCAAFKR